MCQDRGGGYTVQMKVGAIPCQKQNDELYRARRSMGHTVLDEADSYTVLREDGSYTVARKVGATPCQKREGAIPCWWRRRGLYRAEAQKLVNTQN